MKRSVYPELFLRSLLLSASTIGGGFVIISVMRRIYVERLGWLTEEDMLDVTSLAQTCPGAVAVNASILVGHKIAGLWGAVVSVAGTVLPPLFIMSLIAALYHGFGDIALITKLMTGMQAGVAAVILDAALSLSKTALSGGVLRYVIFAFALFVTVFSDIDTAYVILGAALAGVIVHCVRVIRKKAAV